MGRGTLFLWLFFCSFRVFFTGKIGVTDEDMLSSVIFCMHAFDGYFAPLENAALAREKQRASKCCLSAQIKADFRAAWILLLG